MGFTAISTSPASVLNMFSLYLSAWPDLIHKVLFTIGMQASQLFGSAMDKRVCPLLSPCIAVRRNHFQVAAISAYYGRSPHYRVGRAILQGYPCAPAARPRGSCNQASLRESCPQGVTIPNADAENLHLSYKFYVYFK